MLCVMTSAFIYKQIKIIKMARSIRIPNGIISLVDVDFKCPKCECPHEEKDYYPQLYKSKNGLIYKKCRGCKSKLGITSNIMGDVVVWMKEEEKKCKITSSL